MGNKEYEKRTYRNLTGIDDLVSFNVIVQETDLQVYAKKPLQKITRDLILKHRGFIEKYIVLYPEFLKTLIPWSSDDFAPQIVGKMIDAGKKAGVGPMAAVAGAVAESVGMDLLSYSDEIVVENGGDIFFKTNRLLTVGVYAAGSPLSLKMGLSIDSRDKPVGVCTSSGTVGHSLSLGKADAVCVVSDSCPLADAAATAVGNRVKGKKDIRDAIDFGKIIDGVTGIVVIMGEDAGFWGDVEAVRL
ncbi:MAG: hypothetical protein QG578_1511 [Thermodesulfobacteriota bacterium]|nr:hypothetical protein [Thermodesulfobacteriota bacterium]